MSILFNIFILANGRIEKALSLCLEKDDCFVKRLDEVQVRRAALNEGM